MSLTLVEHEKFSLNKMHPKHVTNLAISLSWNGLGYLGGYAKFIASCVMMDADFNAVQTICCDWTSTQREFETAEFFRTSSLGRLEPDGIMVRLPLFDIPREVSHVVFKIHRHSPRPAVPKDAVHFLVANHKQEDLCHLSLDCSLDNMLIANLTRNEYGWDITAFGSSLASDNHDDLKDRLTSLSQSH